MANIKFSQFTQKTTIGNVDFLVGYTGAQNIQIDPVDLLSSYPTGSGATGRVAFWEPGNNLSSDYLFKWDNSNNRLGIGVETPAAKLHIAQDGNASIEIERTTAVGNPGSSRLTVANNGQLAISSDNLITFKTSGASGGTERMRIANAGNVGIGTTSPSAKLQVEGSFISSGVSQLGTTGVNVLLTSSSAGNVGIGDSGPTAKLVVNNVGTKMLELKRSGNIKFRALADSNHAQLDMFNSSLTKNISLHSNGDSYFNGGNVGIGTTSPAYKLDVAGVIQGTGSIRVDAGSPYFGLYNSGTEKAYLQWSQANSLLTLQSDGDIEIKPGANNVGIGTSSPSNLLHVEGDPNNAGVLVRFKGSSSLGSLIRFDRGSSFDWKIGVGSGAATTGIPSSYYGIAESSIGPRLVIAHTTGNVGIGTTSPASKLEVDGGDIEVDDSASGLILRSPDGTRYRVTVANGGTLSVSAV